ncbi:MAG TPA: 50S ribosomal protein L9 [Alphaproteobacteria bacterium]|nr:50S ribosomal protein L9 [Alphaproteobacteria bacterium]
MKIILTEKINKLGNIGDTVEVKTGFARNYLLPNAKAMRWSAANIAIFESKKAELHARQEAAKKTAEGYVDAVKNAKLHMIRQAGDTGQLYGSVSSRDIARMLAGVAGVRVDSAQVMLGTPIKTVGSFDTKVALHADVIVPVKVYVAQTQDEIDALVAGKVLTFGTKKVEEVEEEKSTTEEVVEKSEKPAKTAKAAKAEKSEEEKSEKPARKPRAKKAEVAE